MTLAPIKTLAHVEQDHVLYVLRYCNGNKAQAAKFLGISRRGIDLRLKRYGVDVAYRIRRSHAGAAR